MKVTVGVSDCGQEAFIIEGPNVDYYFKDEYLFVTSDCSSHRPEKKVAFNADKVFCDRF